MEKNLEENAPESPNESSTQLFRKEKSSRIFTWANLDIFINNLNHGLIAITTFYLTWLCVKAGITHHFSMHTIIATIGYQVLMAQGIMVFWKRNTYTILVDNRDKKATLHWVLLGLGTILGVLGTFWEYVWREQNNRRHFVNRHGVWGLYSMYLLIPTVLSGLLALFPQPLRKFLKPLLSKFSHNVFGVAAFVTGMISTIFAYTDLRWAKGYDPGYMGQTMAWCLSFVTAICLLGPLRSFLIQSKAFFDQARDYFGRR